MNLKTGQFFSIDKENLEKTKCLGNNSNELKYYTPIEYKNKWYMVNSKNHEMFYCESIEEYINSMDRNQAMTYFRSREVSEGCNIPLTEESLKLFDFIFDLRDCVEIKRREAEEYRKEDVYEIQLDMGTPFPSNLTLIKKGTEKDPNAIQRKILETFARRTNRPCYNDNAYQETLKEFENLGNSKNEELLKEFKAYAKRLKKAQEFYESTQEDLKLIDIESGRLFKDI